MNILKGIIGRTQEIQDLMKFLWKVKMWFLIPLILVLIIFGALVFFAQTTGVAPFIYTLI